MAESTDGRGLRRSARNMPSPASSMEVAAPSLEKDSLQFPPTPLSSKLTNASLSPRVPTLSTQTITSSRSSSPLSEIQSEEEAELRTVFESKFPGLLASTADDHRIETDDNSKMKLRDKRTIKRPDAFGLDENAASAYFQDEDPDATPSPPAKPKRGKTRPKTSKTAMNTKSIKASTTAKTNTNSSKTSKTTSTTVSRQTRPRGRITKPKPISRKSLVVTIKLTPELVEALQAIDRPKPAVQFLEEVDPVLIALSDQLTYRPSIANKPFPRGNPQVYADTRQSLYETTSYFNRPQGGVHFKDGRIYGCIFDGEREEREYMDSDIMITRAPGKREQDGHTRRQASDHSMDDPVTHCALRDMELQNPIVCIIGNKMQGSQCKFRSRYSVLGWYKLVEIWEEKVESKPNVSVISIRYRYERLGVQEPAWHAPEVDAIAEAARSHILPLHSETCGSCDKTWKQMYLEGWMCLNSRCPQFWKIRGDPGPLKDLHFNPAYLFDRTPWADETEPYPVKHPLPVLNKALGDHLAYINTRGIVCPDCGRCNCRYRFEGWVCDNPKCSWPGLFTTAHPIARPTLHHPWEKVGNGPSLLNNRHSEMTRMKIKYVAGYKLAVYTWDGIDGCLVHATANAAINQEAGGPDDMLQELQTVPIGLERRRFSKDKKEGGKRAPVSRKRGEEDESDEDESDEEGAEVDEGEVQCQNSGQPDLRSHMNAFTMNYGMPYKFIAKGLSKSFDDGPNTIREARSRLSWAANAMLGEPKTTTSAPAAQDHPMTDVDENDNITVASSMKHVGKNEVQTKTAFNELLVVAYYECQKMNYHDDGEEGLGPRIATLSLGGKAKMLFRVKEKHWKGYSKTSKFTPDKPIPLCAGDYEEKLADWKDFDALQGKKQKQVEFSKELVTKWKKINKGFGTYGQPLVEMTLSHGDIVLMEGDMVQKYIEHSVEPMGYLRFALTCRDVLPSHLKDNELPSYEVLPDAIGYGGPVFNQNNMSRIQE